MEDIFKPFASILNGYHPTIKIDIEDADAMNNLQKICAAPEPTMEEQRKAYREGQDALDKLVRESDIRYGFNLFMCQGSIALINYCLERKYEIEDYEAYVKELEAEAEAEKEEPQQVEMEQIIIPLR